MKLQFEAHQAGIPAVTYMPMGAEPEAFLVSMAALIPTTGPWLLQLPEALTMA